MWYYKREKTGIAMKGKPLIPEAMDIIERYHDPAYKYVFDKILGNGYDKDEMSIKLRVRDYITNLRKRYITISKQIELDGYFTFYTARHSSATHALQKGAHIKSISQLLDHANIATTNAYIGLMEKKELYNTLNLLSES